MMHVWWNSTTSGNERLVLLAIADEADDDGRNAFPSVRRLAGKVNCHPATILRAVVRLEKSGELSVIRPESPAPGRGNRYRIHLRPIPPPEEIRARYAGDEDDSKTVRKLRAVDSKNRAHSKEKPRASHQQPRAPMRADPKTHIDPRNYSNDGLARHPEQRPDCPECDGTTLKRNGDGTYGWEKCSKGCA
jgi:hypothetical protein